MQARGEWSCDSESDHAGTTDAACEFVTADWDRHVMSYWQVDSHG